MPDGLMTKLEPHAVQADVQSTAQSLVLISLTGLQQVCVFLCVCHMKYIRNMQYEILRSRLPIYKPYELTTALTVEIFVFWQPFLYIYVYIYIIQSSIYTQYI
jgi:hypothetical protein